jgi:hypothetical protein
VLLATTCLVAAALDDRPATAGCTPVGTTITCTGTTSNAGNGFGDGTQNGLTINVVTGAQVTGTGATGNGIAVNDGNTVNNAGAIAGQGDAFTTDGNGIIAGSLAAPPAGPLTLTVNNASTGSIVGTNLGVVAFANNNTTLNVINSGLIKGTEPGWATAISGDNNVNVTNNAGATISGGLTGIFANNIAAVTNFGTITAASSGTGIQAFIGNINNYGLISTTGALSGTPISITSGTVNNSAPASSRRPAPAVQASRQALAQSTCSIKARFPQPVRAPLGASTQPSPTPS